jgi:antitoxin ParD1/3/4
MAILTLTVTRQETALIEKLLESGRFQNLEEIVQQGLQRLNQESHEDSAREDALMRAIQEGIDDMEQGRYTEIHDSDEITRFLNDLSRDTAEEPSVADK